MTHLRTTAAAARQASRPLVTVALLLGLAVPAIAGDDDPAALWAATERHFAAQRYADALWGYERLAVHGDARAAERAGAMLLAGPAMYGDAVRQDPARAETWLRQAAAAGRPEAKRLVERLEWRDAPGAQEPRYVPGPHGC